MITAGLVLGTCILLLVGPSPLLSSAGAPDPVLSGIEVTPDSDAMHLHGPVSNNYNDNNASSVGRGPKCRGHEVPTGLLYVKNYSVDRHKHVYYYGF
jgi:hypothetical protein